MAKVVINTCYGGFGISNEAREWLLDHGMSEDLVNNEYDIPRHDKLLVECVETLGQDANSWTSELAVVEIYEDQYRIEDYDGKETIYTPESDCKHFYISINDGD